MSPERALLLAHVSCAYPEIYQCEGPIYTTFGLIIVKTDGPGSVNVYDSVSSYFFTKQNPVEFLKQKYIHIIWLVAKQVQPIIYLNL